MLLKKPLLIYLLLFFTASMLSFKQPGKRVETIKWAVLESSNLQVNGSTNVSQFSCDIPACTEIDTLVVSPAKTGKEVTLSGRIDLSVQTFDCHNNMMTTQLRKTMKEKQFPKLYVRFLSLSNLPDLTTDPKPITGQIEIEIAGVNKHFVISYHISSNSQKIIALVGEQDVNFSDFNLTPPKKLAGLVHTNDKLKVAFHLDIKPVEQAGDKQL